jgi:uncharacterized membrane protein (DUF441 family)
MPGNAVTGQKSLSIHAITRRVDRLIILARISRHVRYNPVYSAGLAALGFISHNTTVAISILVLIIVRVTPLNVFFPGLKNRG